MLSNDCELPLEDLDKTVKPIIDSCTKDAILVRQLLVTP